MNKLIALIIGLMLWCGLSPVAIAATTPPAQILAGPARTGSLTETYCSEGVTQQQSEKTLTNAQSSGFSQATVNLGTGSDVDYWCVVRNDTTNPGNSLRFQRIQDQEYILSSRIIAVDTEPGGLPYELLCTKTDKNQGFEPLLISAAGEKCYPETAGNNWKPPTDKTLFIVTHSNVKPPDILPYEPPVTAFHFLNGYANGQVCGKNIKTFSGSDVWEWIGTGEKFKCSPPEQWTAEHWTPVSFNYPGKTHVEQKFLEGVIDFRPSIFRLTAPRTPQKAIALNCANGAKSGLMSSITQLDVVAGGQKKRVIGVDLQCQVLTLPYELTEATGPPTAIGAKIMQAAASMETTKLIE